MAISRNNVATADTYTPELTITWGPCVRLNIEVNNASVYFRLGTGKGGGVTWGAETMVRAGDFRSYDRAFNAVQVRSATPGKPARVTMVALDRVDLDGEDG